MGSIPVLVVKMRIYKDEDMADNTAATTSGITFHGLLTILFIGLKLTHYVEWSWWLVLAPSWAPLVIMLIILTIAIVCKLIVKLLS